MQRHLLRSPSTSSKARRVLEQHTMPISSSVALHHCRLHWDCLWRTRGNPSCLTWNPAELSIFTMAVVLNLPALTRGFQWKPTWIFSFTQHIHLSSSATLGALGLKAIPYCLHMIKITFLRSLYNLCFEYKETRVEGLCCVISLHILMLSEEYPILFLPHVNYWCT